MTKTAAKPSLCSYRQLPKEQPLREAIIDHAVAILTAEGASGFSALKVAKSLGIRQSHLTYHYPSRERLLHALVDRLLSDYAEKFALVVTRTLQGDEGGDLGALIDWLLADAVSPVTARLFPALWELANQDARIAAELDRFYAGAMAAAFKALGLDPASPAVSELQAVMAVLGALVEGTTAIHGRSGARDPGFQLLTSTAQAILLPALQQALETARATRPTNEADGGNAHEYPFRFPLTCPPPPGGKGDENP
jgi:AcrR family transcriptional regulator